MLTLKETVILVSGFLLNGTVKSIQEDLKDPDLMKHYLNVSTINWLVLQKLYFSLNDR